MGEQAAFGRLTAHSQRQHCKADEQKSYEMCREAWLKSLCRLMSSSPNVYRRHARLRGAVRGMVGALSQTTISGRDKAGALADLNRLEALMANEFQVAKCAILDRQHFDVKIFEDTPVDVAKKGAA